MYNYKHKPSHHCRVCGLKINQGNYCIGHRQNYLHDHYAASPARYERLQQALQKELVLLQAGPAMGLNIDEAKIKEKISKLQAKLQEMERLNPDLKTEQEKEKYYENKQ